VTTPIRVLIVDDHAVVRTGLRALLDTEPDLEVAGDAANGLEAIEQVEGLQPDVVLMDLEMPVMGGVDAIRHLTEQGAQCRILVLTSFATDDKVFPAIKAGALGYLLKEVGPDELTKAIRRVHRGESSLDPTVARRLLSELTGAPKSKADPAEALSAREVEVLQLVAKGWSNKQIAAELVISEATVRTHVSNILGKLHLASRTQAALYALREGYASLDDTDDDSGSA
jgi:NarL family two-component system response regulator LiaR